MIGGVLVNKSVDEVAGILNHDLKVMTSQKGLLEEELVSKRKEMDTWMKDNKVKIVKQ